jgi:HK97 family phage portal protein
MGLLATIIRAATPENPSFGINDPDAWDALDAGRPASSGVRVNAELALGFSPWWKGVSLISFVVGKIPLYVLRGDAAARKRQPTHPAFFLLWKKPNPYQTALTFKRQLTGHAVTRGNGYALIDRDGAGRPTALWPLDPARTFPVRENGRVWIVTGSDKVADTKLDPSDVLHIKGLSYDGLCGYSVVDKAREALGEGMASQQVSSSYFKKGARPSVVLEAPGQIREDQVKLLRGDWERMHTGADNMHRTAILDRGLKANVLSFSARDNQLIQGREFNVLEIANFLGLPPHKLGSTARTSYASLEQENQACLDEAYDPWLCTWEEETWDKLLSEEEKRSAEWLTEFDRQELARADALAQSALYRAALGGAPWMTRNEVRGRMHLPPVAGGDELLDPANMGQGGFANEPNDPAKDNKKPPAAGLRPVAEDAAARACRRLRNAAERAARRPAEFLAWLDLVAAEHEGAVADIFGAAGAAMGFDARRVARRLVGAFREDLLRVAGECTAAELLDVVARRSAALEVIVAQDTVEFILGGL